jgi:hypothetical protein
LNFKGHPTYASSSRLAERSEAGVLVMAAEHPVRASDTATKAEP